jgi:hypothetical protein
MIDNIINNTNIQSEQNHTENIDDSLLSFNNFLLVLVNTKYEELTEETFNCGFENTRSKDLLYKLTSLFSDIESINENTNQSNILLSITRLRVINKFYWEFLPDLLNTSNIGSNIVFPLLSTDSFLVKKAILTFITEINVRKSIITNGTFLIKNISRICRCTKYTELQDSAFKCLLSFFDFEVNKICFDEIIDYYLSGVNEVEFINMHFQNSMTLFSMIFEYYPFLINLSNYQDEIRRLFACLLVLYSRFKENIIKRGVFLLSKILMKISNLDPSSFVEIYVNITDRSNWKEIIVEEII